MGRLAQLLVGVALLVGCTSSVPAPTREAADLTLPRGAQDVPLRGGPEIRISADAVSVEGVRVVRLMGGRASSEQLPTDAPLRVELANVAGRGREEARRSGKEWDERVVILADHATPFATLGDTLFTAAMVGFRSFELVVTDGRVRHVQPLSPPREWFPPDPDIKLERALLFEFVVGPDGVTVGLGGRSNRKFGLSAACPPAPNGCYDYAAIGAFAAEIKAKYPNEVMSTFRVDGEVPLQALVTLIDAVSGVDCRISRALAGEKVPDECLFWQPIVDFNPRVRVPGWERAPPTAALWR